MGWVVESGGIFTKLDAFVLYEYFVEFAFAGRCQDYQSHCILCEGILGCKFSPAGKIGERFILEKKNTSYYAVHSSPVMVCCVFFLYN